MHFHNHSWPFLHQLRGESTAHTYINTAENFSRRSPTKVLAVADTIQLQQFYGGRNDGSVRELIHSVCQWKVEYVSEFQLPMKFVWSVVHFGCSSHLYYSANCSLNALLIYSKFLFVMLAKRNFYVRGACLVSQRHWCFDEFGWRRCLVHAEVSDSVSRLLTSRANRVLITE